MLFSASPQSIYRFVGLCFPHNQHCAAVCVNKSNVPGMDLFFSSFLINIGKIEEPADVASFTFLCKWVVLGCTRSYTGGRGGLPCTCPSYTAGNFRVKCLAQRYIGMEPRIEPADALWPRSVTEPPSSFIQNVEEAWERQTGAERLVHAALKLLEWFISVEANVAVNPQSHRSFDAIVRGRRGLICRF